MSDSADESTLGQRKPFACTIPSMMSRRNPIKVLKAFSAAALVVGLAGLSISMILNGFVLERFDAYGNVPIPGSRTLRLPAGEVTVSYEATIPRSTRDGGRLPVPDLNLDIEPPAGAPAPQAKKDVGAPTIANRHAHRQMWVVSLPTDGEYRVTVSGEPTGGAADASLAFGRDRRIPWLPWLFGSLLSLGFLSLIGGGIWLTRRRRAAQRPALEELAALRDSGAITQEQYRAQRHRILYDD